MEKKNIKGEKTMKKLEGKVALITGAAVGLGKGIATVYAKYGAKMCLVDLLPEVEETAKEIKRNLRRPNPSLMSEMSPIKTI